MGVTWTCPFGQRRCGAHRPLPGGARLTLRCEQCSAARQVIARVKNDPAVRAVALAMAGAGSPAGTIPPPPRLLS